ncbi:hypothetical protein AAFA46_08095 [Oscillospiraceae bacterium WX1]
MLEEKDEEIERPLDSTIISEVILYIQTWINSESILATELYLDYVEDSGGIGFCIKTDYGQIVEEDILGNISAEVVFFIYYKTSATPDGDGLIYKPLNDLSEWFVENDFTYLDLGTRRTPREITTINGPVDTSGQDEYGNTTFYSTYKLLFYEEAE